MIRTMTRHRKDNTPHPTEERAPYPGGHSKFERFLLSIMGPANIGENEAPEGYVPDEAANLCRKCGQPWDAHGRVHSDKMTYRPCPTPQH
jgi:hypothetical protein